MGDVLKLTKDKRHRSSSSLAGATVEGTRSERKLELNASIPEADDQFAVAEARCKDLQEKIDLIKSLKKKKKLKKRSTTKVVDPSLLMPENVPIISVRTQPKKKMSPQAVRQRRFEVSPNPTRGYIDPATVEQHRMIGQVGGFGNEYKQPLQERVGVGNKTPVSACNITEQGKSYPKMRTMRQRSHADGDISRVGVCGQGIQITTNDELGEVACGQEDLSPEYSTYSNFDDFERPIQVKAETPHTKKPPSSRRRHVPRDVPAKNDADEVWQKPSTSPVPRRKGRIQHNTPGPTPEERPVVELYNKSFANPHLQRLKTDSIQRPGKPKKDRPPSTIDDMASRLGNLNVSHKTKKDEHHHPRRVKYHSRRYELPTVASEMKRAGMRYYYETANHTNIPFVVSKSTAPSHNIGVNIQQVLNGLKIQQPLSGIIPLTIAHHMGLGHVPLYASKRETTTPALNHREINAIKVGQRLLRLPSYKYVSYGRLLSLYREGDGMVPRFLRAISRPHYFYTSMYNLSTNHEDFEGATSKGHAVSQDAKQNLTEFANLYREYEKINKCIKEGKCEPGMETRREELSKELIAREQNICRLVQDYRTTLEPEPLRASVSTADEGFRHSTFKLTGDSQH